MGHRPLVQLRRKLPGPAGCGGSWRSGAARIPRAPRAQASIGRCACDLRRALPRPVGPNPRRPVGAPGALVDLLDARFEHRIGPSATRRRAFQPGVVAAGGNLQHAAHREHRKVGLVRSHELVDGPDPESASRANQAVAFARIPVRYAVACSHGGAAATPPARGGSARRGAPPHRVRPGLPSCGSSARTVRIPWPAPPGYDPPGPVQPSVP